MSQDNITSLREYFKSFYSLTSTTIVGLGDSIMRGEASATYGFIEVMSKHYHWNLYNFGTNGGSVHNQTIGSNLNMSEQVDQALQPCLKNGKVVINFMTNDAISPLAGNTNWVIDYKAQVQRLLNYGFVADNILLTTSPYQPTRPAADYIAAVQQIAIDMGCRFWNQNAFTQANGGATLLFDALHPTTNGHNVIGNEAINHIN